MTKQIGLSPKVLNPLILGAVIGLALVIAGLVADNDELLTAGIALIGGALGITGGVGYASSPGTVALEPQPASDDALSKEAVETVGQAAEPGGSVPPTK